MKLRIDIHPKNEPFADCASSVEVIFTDLIGRQKQTRQYGLVELDTVFDWIANGEPVNLQNKYVKDFSLVTYRTRKNLGADTQILLTNFNATDAFFDIEHEVDFSFGLFDGTQATFNNVYFGNGPVSFYHAHFRTSNADFEACHFGAGLANFSYTTFECKTANFQNAIFFDGEVQFISSKFNDSKVNFKNIKFGQGNVDFHYSEFGNGHVSFEKSEFEGGNLNFKRVHFAESKVDFRRVSFGDGNIDFSETTFGVGRINFKSSKFGNGDINFENCISESDILFDSVEFGSGNLSFLNAKMVKLSMQLCHLNNYVDLRIQEAHKIDLSYTIVRDIIDMMPTEKSPVKLDLLVLTGMRNLGNIYIDFRLNKVKKLILSQPETTHRQKADQFLILKQTYQNTGRYADEDNAYIMYKRFELKADLEQAIAKNPWNAAWIYPSSFFKWLLFDKVGHYATDPLRVLFSGLIIYSTFSLVYLAFPGFTDGEIATGITELLELVAWKKSFYFSAITFFTVGYGDFYPLGLFRWIAAFEGYMGIFLMSYFTVAFVRKILR